MKTLLIFALCLLSLSSFAQMGSQTGSFGSVGNGANLAAGNNITLTTNNGVVTISSSGGGGSGTNAVQIAYVTNAIPSNLALTNTFTAFPISGIQVELICTNANANYTNGQIVSGLACAVVGGNFAGNNQQVTPMLAPTWGNGYFIIGSGATANNLSGILIPTPSNQGSEGITAIDWNIISIVTGPVVQTTPPQYFLEALAPLNTNVDMSLPWQVVTNNYLLVNSLTNNPINGSLTVRSTFASSGLSTVLVWQAWCSSLYSNTAFSSNGYCVFVVSNNCDMFTSYETNMFNNACATNVVFSQP